MVIHAYERPREKLQNKGVSALTNTELLQVIIGSGNASAPVTKIARKVYKVLQKHGLDVSTEQLTATPGLGIVKAGQILASLELASRLAYTEGNESNGEDMLASLYDDLRSAKEPTLLYVFFDGNNKPINDTYRILNNKKHTSSVVRQLFVEALAQSTASVHIAVGYSNQSLDPTMFELSLARDIFKTASLLSLPVSSFKLISETGEYLIKEQSNG
jgi:DNA repair protein RadC